jgi:glycine/D-amino acid oxidase-like deaminating enzyme
MSYNRPMEKPLLVVGAGMLGSLVSWELSRCGRPFILTDDSPRRSAAYASGGLLNPRPGRWLPPLPRPLDFAQSQSFFQAVAAERRLPLLQSFPLLRPFLDEVHLGRLLPNAQEDPQLDVVLKPGHETRDLAPLGGIWVQGALRFDWESFINSWLSSLGEGGLWVKRWFSEDELRTVEGRLLWQGKEIAGVLHCGGAQSPLEDLRPVKGQSLLLALEEGPAPPAFVKGRWLIPAASPGLFYAGSTFEKPPFSPGPTQEGEDFILEFLRRQLPRNTWKVIQTLAGLRAVTAERKPIFRLKREKKILYTTGLGSKGGLWASYLAPKLAEKALSILEGGFDPWDLLEA